MLITDVVTGKYYRRGSDTEATTCIGKQKSIFTTPPPPPPKKVQPA